MLCLKIAREQQNELVEEYILQAGNTDSGLDKIQEVLFRQKHRRIGFRLTN